MEMAMLDTLLVEVEVSVTIVENRAQNHRVTRQPNTGCTSKGNEITIRKKGYVWSPQQHY